MRKGHRGRLREQRRGRASSVERGYDSRHWKLRKQYAAVVASGQAVCWRCGRSIDPREPWDLGHDDADRSVYRGPEHRRCNRATSGRKPNAVSSRNW